MTDDKPNWPTEAEVRASFPPPRYRLVGYDIGTAPDENGGWVHWTDHEAIVARLPAAIAGAEAYAAADRKIAQKTAADAVTWKARAEKAGADLKVVLDREAETHRRHDERVTALEAERDAAMAGAVNVKPLVWVEDLDRDSETFGAFVACDPMLHLRYVVCSTYRGDWMLTGSVPFALPTFPTVEAAKAAAQADYVARIRAALQPDPEGRQADLAKAYGPILDLLPDAVCAAEKAMRKYPQPNYVISKWAEETGEVTKDLIHMAEGRQTADKLRGEIVQSLAMLHRLMVEGDQVHGLPPVGPAIRALTPPADMAAKIGGDA